VRSLGLALAVLMLAASVAQAAQAPQTARPGAPAQPAPPTPPAPTQPAPAPAPAQNAAPPQPESYTYNADGRRDPFLSLLGTGGGGDTRGSRRGEGATGITVAEISVRGVMQSRDGLIAMIQGPDSRTYIVHAGDRLADGTIKAITPQGLVVIQEVNDPLSLVKQREVLKLLRTLESAKE
jgi:Tfp pilus assembly protein PilP